MEQRWVASFQGNGECPNTVVEGGWGGVEGFSLFSGESGFGHMSDFMLVEAGDLNRGVKCP